jgi:hypothetical protein
MARHLPLLALAAAAFLLGCALTPSPDPAGWQAVGEGDHRYGWDPAWGARPDGSDLGNTHGGIVVDAAGRIYVNTDTEDAVMVFHPDGRLLDRWGADLAGGLHGMTIAERRGVEHLWLTHTGRHEVYETTLGGRVLRTFPWPEASGKYASAGEFRPTGVAVAPDGRVFVADGYGKGWIHEYTAEGEWTRCWGGPGTEPGRFRTPHGILLDTRGAEPRLVVADRENARLQVFDLDGGLLEVVEGMFRRPCMAAQRGDELVVADLAGRVTVLDRDNRLVTHLGDQPDTGKRANNGVPRAEWAQGEFLAPHAAAWDARGDLYVMDWLALGRVTRLQRL